MTFIISVRVLLYFLLKKLREKSIILIDRLRGLKSVYVIFLR
jgi:hypothetical protein